VKAGNRPCASTPGRSKAKRKRRHNNATPDLEGRSLEAGRRERYLKREKKAGDVGGSAEAGVLTTASPDGTRGGTEGRKRGT